jgi:hypothetical protein
MTALWVVSVSAFVLALTAKLGQWFTRRRVEQLEQWLREPDDIEGASVGMARADRPPSSSSGPGSRVAVPSGYVATSNAGRRLERLSDAGDTYDADSYRAGAKFERQRCGAWLRVEANAILARDATPREVAAVLLKCAGELERE